MSSVTLSRVALRSLRSPAQSRSIWVPASVKPHPNTDVCVHLRVPFYLSIDASLLALPLQLPQQKVVRCWFLLVSRFRLLPCRLLQLLGNGAYRRV